MKFMITYAYRRDGLDFNQYVSNTKALINAFAKWRPEEGLKVHAFVAGVSGDGGFILVEAEDAKPVFTFIAKFVGWNSCQVQPVIDVTESVGIARASLEWAVASTAA